MSSYQDEGFFFFFFWLIFIIRVFEASLRLDFETPCKHQAKHVLFGLPCVQTTLSMSKHMLQYLNPRRNLHQLYM